MFACAAGRKTRVYVEGMHPGFTFIFPKRSFPALHHPRPKRLPTRGSGRGITSRFPLAFRRILWVTTTKERTEKGRMRHRCPRSQGTSQVQGTGPEPRTVQTSLSPRPERGVRVTPQTQTIHPRVDRTPLQGTAPSTPSQRYEVEQRLLCHVLDKTEAPKGHQTLRCARAPLHSLGRQHAGQGPHLTASCMLWFLEGVRPTPSKPTCEGRAQGWGRSVKANSCPAAPRAGS